VVGEAAEQDDEEDSTQAQEVRLPEWFASAPFKQGPR